MRFEDDQLCFVRPDGVECYLLKNTACTDDCECATCTTYEFAADKQAARRARAQSQPTVAPARLTAPYSPIPEGGFVTHASQCGDAPEPKPRPTIADLQRKIAQVERSVDAIAAGGWSRMDVRPVAPKAPEPAKPRTRSFADEMTQAQRSGSRVPSPDTFIPRTPGLSAEDEEQIAMIERTLAQLPTRLSPERRRQLAVAKYYKFRYPTKGR